MSNTNIEPYDHSKKIGNEGDTAKHAILANLTKHVLLDESDRHSSYFESHAGRYLYKLPESGEWEQGIRKFSQQLVEGGINSNETANSKGYPNIGHYVEQCFKEPIGIGSQYLGSSGIVASIIVSQGIQPVFNLCEIEEQACEALKESFKDHPEVTIHKENGYEMVKKIDPPTLALIDPIHVKEESEQILSTLEQLSSNDSHFMCWTALWGADEEFYRDFRAEIDKNWSSFWIVWKERKHRTWGCQISVSKSLENLTADTIDEIRKITGWS